MLVLQLQLQQFASTVALQQLHLQQRAATVVVQLQQRAKTAALKLNYTALCCNNCAVAAFIYSNVLQWLHCSYNKACFDVAAAQLCAPQWSRYICSCSKRTATVVLQLQQCTPTVEQELQECTVMDELQIQLQ